MSHSKEGYGSTAKKYVDGRAKFRNLKKLPGGITMLKMLSVIETQQKSPVLGKNICCIST